MLSKALDRISFLSLLLVVTLLPLFFLPFTGFPVEISKGLLLVVGLVVSIVFWTVARFSDGKIVLPKSPLLVAGFIVVLVVLLSAFFSSAQQLSFFGTMFDVGSFWFIFSCFLLMLASSIIFRKMVSARIVLFGIILSSALALIFQAVHLFFPATLSFGILAGKTDNLLGSWNAFGLFAGFLGIMSLYIIEFFSTSRFIKSVLYIFLVLAVLLMAAVNYLLAWEVFGIFALIIFLYKISFSFGSKEAEGERQPFPGLSFSLFMIALLFFMSSQFIGGFLPGRLGLANIEVSPSFGVTAYVAKSALTKNPVFGLGPNRFADAWSMYKPKDINNSIFWDTAFNSGSGLIPTLVSTTGYVGLLAWIVFFALFVVHGAKLLFSSVKKGVNKEMAAFFVASLYLFVSAFFHSTGPALFLLAFAFCGAFIGLSTMHQPDKEISLSFSEDPRKSFFSLIFLILLMVVSSAVGFKYVERFASVSYFGKALSAQSAEAAQSSILKALSLYTNDVYLRSYARIQLSKIGTLTSKGGSLSDTDKAALQASLDQSISAAKAAIAYDPNNYVNFSMLGSVYANASVLGVKDAYDMAIAAYKQAETVNPFNPGIKLSMSTAAFSSGKISDAKDYAKQALSLKPDYIDALITLSQIAKSQGNTSEALSYAQQALALDPQNKDLIDYEKSLKSGGSIEPAPAPKP